MNMIRVVLTLGISAACLFAADDPFIGRWKLNQEKSNLTGQKIKIEIRPDNRYVFQEDEASDEILADGLDHLTHFGETMSVSQKAANSWSITYKKDGRTLMTTLWTVSSDGQQLTYLATGTRLNGQPFSNSLTAKRIEGTSGLAGTWQSTGVKLSSPAEFEIRPYGPNGHTLIFPASKSSLSMKFDGKDYSEIGPNVQEHYASSGRRIDAHSLEVIEKINGKVIEKSHITVSADGNTQTFSVLEPGAKTPVILVYDRDQDLSAKAR